ncbi:hypothetical protein HOLleu_33495 [Holothuria leucospilota]|uniref:Uncharacterized protein n=1 Tax=Holothuria leucospilota TaxID=206669 RepID=A0A9Q1BI31_HOLLE|nr:hypothetical protein HOLleu_33495 [Holothuria leucospilota]
MSSGWIRLLLLASCLACLNVRGIEGKTLYDLRKFHFQGKGARFAVSKEELERKLSGIKKQDGVCGNDVNLELLHTTELLQEAEIFIAYIVMEDLTLSEELSCEMKEKVAVNSSHVFISVPFVSGERHGLLLVAHFTDSRKQTFFPYSTNYDRVSRIDSIDETDSGTVTLRKGNDVMIMNIQSNVTCHRDEVKELREDVDEVIGKLVSSTDYPLPFDWGCDILGESVSFCETLRKNQCGLGRAGSDVCIEMTSRNSKRCPASMQILSMTGLFQDAVPYLSTPASSFEGVWVDREHGTNIVFPCFTSVTKYM